MEVSGIDELQQRYSSEFVVELNHTLKDGKPAAVKLSQLKPLVFLALGSGLPAAKISQAGGQQRRLSDEQIAYIKRVVAKSVTAVREVYRAGPDEPWLERWTPVVVLADREPRPDADPRELHVDFFDWKDTVIRCWKKLFQDANHGGELEGTQGVPFRDGGAGADSDDGKDVRKVAARVRSGKERQPR